MRISTRATAAMATVTLVLGLVVVVARDPGARAGATAAGADAVCRPGTISIDEYVRRENRLRASATGRQSPLIENEGLELLETAGLDVPGLCLNEQHPEAFGELFARAADLASPRLAGMGPVREGAFAAAADDRAAMQAGSVPGTAGRGRQYGKGPLDATEFGTASLGIPSSMGRVDDLEYDPASGRLFAAVATGGAWMSEDLGERWVEINGDLPATIVGSLAWTTAGGGRLVAVTGDGSFGGITGFPGIGAWYTDDIGDRAPGQVRWQRASGVPDDALGFKVAVDPSSPRTVYVATSKGLFRSTDGGRSFANADLPTGSCAGVTNTTRRPECQLANVVTDVVVQEPGGRTGVEAPQVVAAVGWRGGTFENPDGTVQSEGNGIYKSTDGGESFAATPMSGFTPRPKRGRIELGAATGPDQDHAYLYAMVQDAEALNGAGCAVLDAPVDCSNGVDAGLGIPVGSINTVIDGVYVSADFGDTWTPVATTESFQNPASGSALNGTAAALGYQPGVQAWYNQFVAPDPTSTDLLTGAPSRLVLGLEEVWENQPGATPLTPATPWRVVGRYFGGQTCGFLDLGALVGFPVPVCPLNTQDPVNGSDTTHPDQHSAIWIPRDGGGADLFVGNDGGVFRQTVGAGEQLSNQRWGPGKNEGFQTLLPYAAAVARDGKVWFGLQDNGTGFIDPEQDFAQFQTFGGDGFFVAVDPKNSDVAYYETPGAAMSVTTDGGESSTAIDPPADGGPYRFNNMFVMDPNDALRLGTAGSKVYITEAGPATTTPTDPANPTETDWQEVFDLGTNLTPGQRPETLAAGEVLNAMSAMDVERNAAYVGFCGVCDILNADAPFQNGIATNVDAGTPAQAGSRSGWRVMPAEGLPNRFITSIAIDPTDVSTVYVTLGGYSRKWASPGTLQDDNPDIGDGHVFRSTDAGRSFRDWSGNLPDVTATWVELRGDQLLVGTDVGAFASRSDGAPQYAPLEDVPATSVGTIQMKPHDPNTAIIATYGRGVWEYTFDDTRPTTAIGRLAGATREETAVRVSREQFDRARTVVLATSQVYADALAAVPLAKDLDAPILLTTPGGLPANVSAEIDRLGARRAVVVGGPAAVGTGVESQLRGLGLTVDRIQGPDRYATAATIAERLPVTTAAYVVEGASADPNRGWPDALAVGPVAAEQGRPVLLVESGRVPAATAAALDRMQTRDVTIVGGTVAVSPKVARALEGDGRTVRRVAGADRYETAALLADLAQDVGLTDHRLWVSRGDNWPDALAAGAAVAANGGTLLLVSPTDLAASPASARWISDHSDDIATVHVLGGELAVRAPVVDQVRRRIQAGPVPEPPPPPLAGEVVASYDFEVDGQGWKSSGSGPGQWMLRPPGNTSGQAWRVEPYLDATSARLTSPEIEHTGGALKISFSGAWSTEACCDFLTAEVRFADGTSVPLLGASGKNASWPAFDRVEETVVGPAGPVTIVFSMSSDQLVPDLGAAIDDVVVER